LYRVDFCSSRKQADTVHGLTITATLTKNYWAARHITCLPSSRLRSSSLFSATAFGGAKNLFKFLQI